MKKIIIRVIFVLTCLVSLSSCGSMVSFSIPSNISTIIEEECTSFTAVISEIEENEYGISIKLDFHDHTVFYYDTFMIYSFNSNYAIDRGLLNEVHIGDTITILTNPFNGPFDYYEIYTLEKDGKIYLTLSETNESIPYENERIRESDKKIAFISGCVFAISTIFTLTLYKKYKTYMHY